MKTILNKPAITVMALLCAFCVKAQVATTYTFSQFMGTYSAISGGTLFNTPTSDDENIVNPANPTGVVGTSSGPGMPIGFNFIFNGYTFDRMAVSNNGYIMFGNSANGNTAIQFQTSGANDHLRPISFTSTSPPVNQQRVAALGHDLQGQPTSNIRLETLGSSPTRTFVAQWFEYKVFAATNNGDTINFQIRLYETTNIIDMVYGKVKSVTLDTTAQVGLRGTSNADFNNRSVTGSLTWPTSVAGTANNYFCRYNTLVYPPNGLTYRWTPAQCSGTLASLIPTGAAFICPNGTSTISLNTATLSGLTYSWTSSTSSSVGPFTSVSNANNPSYITPGLTQTTWYQAQYTCINSASSGTSAPFQVQIAGTSFSTVPYFEGFENILFSDQLPNCSWLTTNTSVCQTYTIGALYNRSPNSGLKYAAFKAPTNASGDYYYSNGIQLNAGVTYSAAMNYITDGFAGWSTIAIMLGTSQTATTMVNIVSDSPALSYTHKYISSIFTVPISGTYYVGIKCIGGGTAAKYLSWDDLSITVPCNLNPFSIGFSASSPSICTGESVNIVASGADKYVWSNGDTTSAIIVTPNTNTTYTAIATNTLSGCTQTISQTVIVYQSPAVSIIGNSTICAGSSATLYAIGASSYQWNNGNPNYYAIVNPTTNTTYTVLGSNSKCSTQAMFTVSVMPLPTISVTSNQPGTICLGEEAILQGNGGVNYTWVSPVTPVQSGGTITVKPNADAAFIVTGTGANGCNGSTTYQLNVSACTAIGESNNAGMKVYPNPASAEITIEAVKGSSYVMYDVIGRLLKSGHSTDVRTTINLGDIPAGIYYLNISSGASSEVLKVVKQ